jgi:serine/threonine protein kinase/Tfp pilus assembly protein PilF
MPGSPVEDHTWQSGLDRSPDALPHDSSRQIDEQARRRFEAAWHAGRPEALEQVLPPADHPDYLGTLQELVLIEMEFLWKGQQTPADSDTLISAPSLPPPVEDYLARFPALNQPGPVRSLLEQEYRLRQRFGDRPTFADYRRRFPHLDLAAPDARATVPQVGAAPWVPDLPGYEILGELGRGNMGVVYRARQASLGRVVALKMILAGKYAGPEERARFRREAEAVARLQHPHIVQIYEIGEHEGRPFFSLEYVTGGSLAERVKGAPKPARPAAQLVETLARAVHHAHERGIVHRDLKPANILLQTTEDTEHTETKHKKGNAGEMTYSSSVFSVSSVVPKITDFGLAKRLDAEAGQTASGAVVGTPCYMAPEQAAGKTRAIGPAADVYALGAILYELVTGRPPFQGDTAADVVAQVVTDEPVPPRRLRPSLPRDLETICLKCLQKDSGQRYPTAEALADDLRRFAAGEPIRARPVGRLERAWRWCRRNPVLAASGVLVAATVIGGWLFWSAAERRQFESEERRRRQAEEYRNDLRSSTAANRRLALAELRADRFASARDILRQAAERIEKEPSLAPQHADLRARLDRARRLARFYQLADEAERIMAERDHPYAQEPNRAATRRCEMALKQLGIFDHRRWTEHLPDEDLTAKQRRRLRTEVYRQLLLLAGVRVQDAVTNFGQPQLAPVYRSCLAALAAARQYRNQSYAARVIELFCFAGLGQWKKVKPLAVRGPRTAVGYYFAGMLHSWIAAFPNDLVTGFALRRGEKLAGLDIKTPLVTAEQQLRMATSLEPRHYWGHMWLGDTLRRMANYPAAELAYAAGVSLRPDYAHGYFQRGLAITDLARTTTDPQGKGKLLDRAQANLNEALRLDPKLAEAYDARAIVHFLRGKFPAAVVDFSAAVRLNPKSPLYIAHRGETYYQLKRFPQAVSDLSAALRLNPKLAWVHNVRANVHYSRGEYGRAVGDYNQAVRLAPRVAVFHANRGRAHAASGHWGPAARDLAQALKLNPADAASWYLLACLRLRAGDVAGYRKACATALKQFGGTTAADAADWAAWACVLAPEAMPDRAGPVRLAERAVATAAGNSRYLTTLGVALYRAGRWKEAIRTLTWAVKGPGNDRRLQAQLFLAMGCYRLGQTKEARKWLNQAVAEIEKRTQGKPTKELPRKEWQELTWNVRLELAGFRREAELLVNGVSRP